MIASGLAAAELGPWWQTALWFTVLLMASFFFSGTETAFFSLQEIDRRRILEGSTSTQRRVAQLLRNRNALITTILMGNETANIAISATAAGLVAVVAPTKPWITVLVVTPVLVLLSEITPKILAYRFNRLWVDGAVWPIWALMWILLIPRLVFGGLVALLGRLFGVTGTAPERMLGENEFLAFVEQGEKQGVVEEGERELIEAVFELDDLTVDRVMTPKPDMFSIPVDITWDDLVHACRDARYSRVPVYEHHRDNIIGVLLLKDLVRHRKHPLRTPADLQKMLLKPVFVPATKPANEMMKEMLRLRFHIAFVIDEHGTVIGLVSLDDLIIELVGEIEDDSTDAGEAEVRDEPDGTWLASGAVDLDDFQEHTGLELPPGEYHTLAGFLMEQLGRLPTADDRVDHAGYTYVVVRMDGRRISEVRVRPTTDASQDEVSE